MEALVSTLTITCDDFLRLVQECMDLSHTHSAPVTPVGVAGTPSFIGLTGRGRRTNSLSDDEARLRNTHTPSLHGTPPVKRKETTPTSSLPAHLTGSPPTHLTGSLPAHLTGSQLSPDKHVRFDEDNSDQTPTKQELENKPSERRTHSRSNSDIFITPTGTPEPSPPPSPHPHTHALTPSLKKTVRDRALANQSQRPMFEHVTLGGDQEERQFETFFSRPEVKFGDIVLEEGDLVPTEMFLHCARVLLPFFDALSPTAFAPMKADVSGNIEKTSAKFQTDPALFPTLQSLVIHELDSVTAGAGSATEGLLWLKRGMEFIYLFLGEVSKGEHALDVAAGKAYSKSLRQHHNWMVRGIFSLAMRAVPYYTDFLAILGSDGSEESERQVVRDMAEFAQSLEEVCIILDQFLIQRGVEVEH